MVIFTEEKTKLILSEMLKAKEIREMYDRYIDKSLSFEEWVKRMLNRVIKRVEEEDGKAERKEKDSDKG